jgi:23S rRNA (uracil1939-C5)-methyltransferase
MHQTDGQSCAIVSQCQGCPLINAPYARQLEAKREDFETALKDLNPSVTISSGPMEPSPVRLGYRHSVKLAVALDPLPPSSRGPLAKGAKPWIRIGLFRPGTRDVTDIGWCAAQEPSLNALIKSLRYALKDNDVPIYQPAAPVQSLRDNRSRPPSRWERPDPRRRAPQTKHGIRYVVLRRAYASSAMHLTLVTSVEMRAKLMIVARHLRQRHPELMGVSVHLNTSPGNAFFDLNQDALDRKELLLGQSELEDCLAGIRVEWSPLAFAQANPGVAERMYRRIWEVADVRPLETWLDVYCGVGIIGLGAAQRAARVVGIEENPASLAQAQRNAALNSITNWSGLVGRAEDLLARGGSTSPAADVGGLAGLDGFPLGVVTLNPSRRGCQPEVIQAVTSRRPRQIIYMSCEAKTLVRDLKLFDSLGYATRLIENHDMFPGTMHYESLAILTPKNA